MRGLVTTGADRKPFSLLAWSVNQHGCIVKLITISKNHRSLRTPPSAINCSMSRVLRRTDRPIQTARIDPEVIRRRAVRAERLRIAAVWPIVRSGSRREGRPSGMRCLLRDSRSVTTAGSPIHGLLVPESNWSSRSRAVEPEQSPGVTSAAAHSGILGDRIFDPVFDALATDPLLPSVESMVEALSGALIPYGPGAADCG
jgi:hypothetical protein